jgi:hypothetical protein
LEKGDIGKENEKWAVGFLAQFDSELAKPALLILDCETASGFWPYSTFFAK